MKQIRSLIMIAVTALFSLTGCVTRQADESAAIRQVVDKYIQTINQADTALVNQIWSHEPQVSFIAPSGYYKTYNEIRDKLVVGLFGSKFTERNLQSEDLVINQAGDMAWVEFRWKFDAIRIDGQPHNTKGQETQILQKDKDGNWKLVHIHYSGR